METHSHIINLFIEFIFKHKRIFLGGYVKQITKSILRDLMVLLLSLYKLLTHISFVSSSRMLVKKESISRPAIYKLGSFLQISAAKWNEPVTVYLFSAKGVKKKKKTCFKNIWYFDGSNINSWQNWTERTSELWNFLMTEWHNFIIW